MPKMNSRKPPLAVFLAVAVLLSAVPLRSLPAEGSSLAEISTSLADVAERVTPAVVRIESREMLEVRTPRGGQFHEFFPFLPPGFQDPRDPGNNEPETRQVPRTGVGSGFIVRKDGVVITNYHVAGDAEKVTVKLADGRELEARYLGGDKDVDLAVLQISDGDSEFPVIPLGDSEAVRVGELVLAIGSSFGELEHSVTLGIVSAVGRQSFGINRIGDFIQTDAAINQGNSGGPLVNIQGEVIGVNTAIIASGVKAYQGVGLSIPSGLTKNILEQVLETGKVTYGYLGVNIQGVDHALAKKLGLEKVRGALVSDVMKDAPAAKAGIRNGDVILSLDGIPVRSHHHLIALVGQSRPGSDVTLEVNRDGRTRSYKVNLAERPRDLASGGTSPEESVTLSGLGLTLQDLTAEIARGLGYEDIDKGVVVTGVRRGSPAAEAGVERDMLILEAEKEEVKSVEQFEKIAAKAREKGEDSLLVLLRKGNSTLYRTIELPKVEKE